MNKFVQNFVRSKKIKQFRKITKKYNFWIIKPGAEILKHGQVSAISQTAAIQAKNR